MKTKLLLALLCGALPLLASVPANAVPSSITFTAGDAIVPYSWGGNPDSHNVTRTGTLSEAWNLTGIGWSGTASPNPNTVFNGAPFFGTNGADLYVNILLGATDLGNFQLGSGGQLAANTAFGPSSSSFGLVAGAAGETLTFRFFEQKDDWAAIEAAIPGLLPVPSDYDALWNSITFSFQGTAPTTTGGGTGGTVPEPATLALLGLGLAGLGMMRRRAR